MCICTNKWIFTYVYRKTEIPRHTQTHKNNARALGERKHLCMCAYMCVPFASRAAGARAGRQQSTWNATRIRFLRQVTDAIFPVASCKYRGGNSHWFQNMTGKIEKETDRDDQKKITGTLQLREIFPWFPRIEWHGLG